MSGYDVRKQFLQWHFSEVDRLADSGDVEGAARFNESMEERWPAWQASRASMVIELPKFEFMIHLDAQGFYKSQVKQAVEAAGVKVKP